MNELTVKISTRLSSLIRESAKKQTLDALEKGLLEQPFYKLSLQQDSEWLEFVEQISQIWAEKGYLIVRGIPIDDGASTILAACALNSGFKPYRGNKIVKHFKMSPWTTGLSHTLKEGFFHTDINTAPEPPAATVIHCINPDPKEGMGETRIVPLKDLLTKLKNNNKHDTLRFMKSTQVDMVDEHKHGSWFGTIVENKNIRFHPETLRAAAKRLGTLPDDLENHLACIHENALEVSSPIHLDSGDAVFVSNHRALHYRGVCTAKFIDFPHKYEARQIYVLHLQDEPQWPQ